MNRQDYELAMNTIKKTAQVLAWNNRTQLELLNALGTIERRRTEVDLDRWPEQLQLRIPR